MKKIYKIIIILLSVICFIAFGIYGGLIGGGSYQYAQQYEFDVTKPVLIKAVQHFKDENPDCKIPENLSLPDDSDSVGRYHFYIYYKKENKIVHGFIWNNIDNTNKSSIYLHAINDGLVLGNWKVINSDYDRSENLKAKEDFNENFLNKLKLRYKNEGNSSFIFWK
jgi:hypothetical protein